ncbi:MAG: T9SS type A sorting domain-containing protein [Ignavibacteria bacterium]|nr:T9SS type A sorting domain-containing protein [Ignavibacteria bacterium]
MKKIILVLLIVHCTLLIAKAQWIQQNSGTNQNLYDIEFINDKSGWAVGDAGVVIKTTNGGTNWINVPNPSGQYGGLMWSICPVDSEVVYAVAGYDFIMKTSNGGLNWNVLSSRIGSTTAFKGVYFLNRDTGWFLGSYKVFRTYDGGNTLDSFYAPWFTNSDIYFKNIDTGIFCGDGVVFKSTNGCINWINTNVSPGIFYQFGELAVVNNKVWVIASGDAPVFHSTDFCDSWNVIDTINCYPPSVMFSVAFANEMTGWTGGTFGWLYKTTDGGYNWLREQTTSDPRFWGSIFCFNDSIVWGAGGAGKIRYTTNGGQTMVSINTEESNEEPEDFTLYQNFPNPFNPETNIEFFIPTSSEVSLKVFDTSGKLIKILLNNIFLNKGKRSFIFNSGNLPSGIYYAQLQSGNINKTNKMVLVK